MPGKITVLLENTKPEQSDFEVEHGLSLYIETDNLTFLFDCGHTGLAWSNVALMNIDLSKVQFVVLSHSHYDHSGGFPALLQHVKPKILYTGVNFWREKFSYNSETDEYKYAGCGFTEADLLNWNIEQKICNDVIKLNNDTWLIGNFAKRYTFETIPKKFVLGEDRIPDDFNDEIVLVMREGDGISVVTGCAHNGILNIIDTVRQRLKLPIYSVIGGIHLKSANAERIEKTITELKNIGVRRLALCHCSGEAVHEHIENYDFINCKISTGRTINIDN